MSKGLLLIILSKKQQKKSDKSPNTEFRTDLSMETLLKHIIRCKNWFSYFKSTLTSRIHQ